MRRIIDFRTGEETVDNDFVPMDLRPTKDEQRDSATLDVDVFCERVFTLGIMNGTDAEAAARGEWPPSFNAIFAGKSPSEVTVAKIKWAGTKQVRYRNALLNEVALAVAGSPAAATALLDQIFGI